MTKLNKYQLTHLRHNTQFILFNLQGKLLESCDSLFSTKNLHHKVVFEWFPFLESISDALQMMEPGQEMLFQRLQKPAMQLLGAYDFKIVRPLTEQNMFLLIIMDYTQIYHQYQQLQQQYNELFIEKQGRERGNVPSV